LRRPPPLAAGTPDLARALEAVLFSIQDPGH
jgi:hypothetical protein